MREQLPVGQFLDPAALSLTRGNHAPRVVVDLTNHRSDKQANRGLLAASGTLPLCNLYYKMLNNVSYVKLLLPEGSPRSACSL
jgi:hypothetical protein